MALPKKAPTKDLGQMLVDARLITEEQLERAKEIQARDAEKLERVLLQQRLITPQQLAFFLSLQLQIPFVNLKQEGVQSQAVALVPESVARKYNAIPVDVTDTDGNTRTIRTICRVDTPVEVDYYRNGGILQTVLRNFLQKE